MEYYIGIDIGGTNLKAGVVDGSGKILGEADAPAGAGRHQDMVFQDILKTVEAAVKNSGIGMGEISAAGIGSPGMINSENGTVIYNNNLGWRDFHIGGKISAALKIPSRLENDADAAALGEVISGSAKGAESAVIITLGTGVGVGAVINGKILPGEFGHMVIAYGGRECTCGRKGCFEAYSSATGLIKMTKEAIAENPDGILAEIAELKGSVDGKTVFDAAGRGDLEAVKIIDGYTDYLACGIANLINGLQPEVVGIGGGIAKQGEKLLAPLRGKVKNEVYKGIKIPEITACTLGYKAGLIGAAMAAKISRS